MKQELKNTVISGEGLKTQTAKTGKKSRYFMHEGLRFYPPTELLKEIDDDNLYEVKVSTEWIENSMLEDDEDGKPTGPGFTKTNIEGYTTLSGKIKRAEFDQKIKRISADVEFSPAQKEAVKAAKDLV